MGTLVLLLLQETDFEPGVIGALFGAFGMLIVVCLAIIVLLIASMWMVYTKAGQPGWAAIVPIYNAIVLLRIVRRPWWWFFLMIIPLVNIVFIILIYIDLAKAFGKGAGYAIGMLFLPFVFYPILGFGSAQYR